MTNKENTEESTAKPERKSPASKKVNKEEPGEQQLEQISLLLS